MCPARILTNYKDPRPTGVLADAVHLSQCECKEPSKRCVQSMRPGYPYHTPPTSAQLEKFVSEERLMRLDTYCSTTEEYGQPQTKLCALVPA